MAPTAAIAPTRPRHRTAILVAFKEANTHVVVDADAGMLSAANLNALEDAGFRFIVGSRISKGPYDLAEHFDKHGGVLHDGETMESKRVMGTGINARERRQGALGIAAMARINGSFFQGRYRRLGARRGPMRALVAIWHPQPR